MPHHYDADKDYTLGDLFGKAMIACADLAKSNWLTQGSANRRFLASVDPISRHIEMRVRDGYQAGRDELMADNERLRNQIAELTAKLALNKTEGA